MCGTAAAPPNWRRRHWMLRGKLRRSPSLRRWPSRRPPRPLGAPRQSAPKPESEAMALALLAAAQAEAGEFEAAVATQREAIAVASESVRDSLRERLKLYEARKPYRRE